MTQINGMDCPLGACDFCNAKHRKERLARCRNNPANAPQRVQPEWVKKWEPSNRDICVFFAGMAVAAVETGMPLPFVLLLFVGGSLAAMGANWLCDRLHRGIDWMFQKVNDDP